MLCYLAGMEPYYLKCIKDGPFQPKTAEGDAKPESQWTPNERRMVVQDQCLKSIIMSCIPDDIMESVISCVSAKETWTDLVHNFEGPSDTKENRIMDLKLEYQTFRAKSTESLLQTYTCYKTLLNELANNDVNLSKHEINVGFVNSLPEKWLTFSQGLRNANHTQTLDLADIYERFVYEDNLIQRRYSDTKKALITTPSSTPISTAFFSNNVIQDFQENSDDEVDERTNYKAEYKKIKAKLALLEASPSSSQNPKTFQPKNKGLIAETFDWDEEEVSYEEEVTQVKVLIALADDELTVRKSHARNGERVDITMRKEKKINEKWLTSSKRNENENLFIPASIWYDQEMVPKIKDWVERLNPDSKLPNFNTRRILVPKSQAVNESLETLNNPESSKDLEAEFLTPLPTLKNLQRASPSSKVMPLTFQPHSPKERPGLGIMKHTKPETHDSSNKSVSGTVTILKAKAKPFQPCTHCGFNDHRPDDCRNYPECEICRSYDHSTSRHNRVIQIRRGVLAESSQSNESLIGVKCNTCGSTVHSTSDHNEFDHFKRGTIFNANKEIILKAPRRNDAYVLDMSSLTPNGACFFAKASESVNWLWHKILSHLNFKNINKLAKQNKVLGLPSLVYSKDKPCTSCEKGKHHRASFKTKQNFFIKKCLHLLHMDLFGPNFSSPYTPEQNDEAERKNITLIEAARTMLNGLVLSKHFWTEAVRVACYTQNRSIIVKRHDKTPNEIFKEIILDISYFYLFRCLVFIHNYKDHLGKFDAKADDGYFLGYSFVSKAFRVFNTRRQQVEETYHVTFSDIIAPNEPEIPHTEDSEGPPDLINTEGTHEQNIQNDQMITQPTDVSSGNNTEGSRSITEPLVPDVTKSHISNHAFTSSHPVPHNRWSRDQHIKLVNIIGDPGEGMLTRSMVAKLTAASASECLFADILSKIEPKKVSEALKHPR
ncbi:retrovirus-related pol polyprotein from transposon TNT 1-94 [Tanacetum coccineum]